MDEETKVFISRAIILVALIAFAIGFPYFLTHTDYIEVKTDYVQDENWVDNRIAEFTNDPRVEQIKTKNQIIIEAGSELSNVLIIYEGDKEPIVIKEESAVSRTGIEVTVITPNEVNKFITER